MTQNPQYLLLLVAISFLISASLTPWFRKLAITMNLVDEPNQAHKTHLSPIPYLGGASIISSSVILLFLAPKFLSIPLESDNWFLLSILLMPLLLSSLGLIDDIVNLDFKIRLFVQISLSVVSAVTLILVGLLGNPTGVDTIDFFVTLFWLVGIPNAVNFIDNLDGVAAGVAIISSFAVGFAAIYSNQTAIAYLAFILGGSTLGFLIWNLQPAKIYLGDFGSLFLGSMLAIIILQLDPPSNSSNNISSWLFGFGLMAVPILDTCCAVISRLRRKVSPFLSGRDHLSHSLIDSGMAKKSVMLVLWGLSLLFCSLAFLILFSEGLLNKLLSIAFVVSWTVLLIFFLLLDLSRRKV